MKRFLIVALLAVVLLAAAVVSFDAPASYTCWRLVDGRCLPAVTVTPQPTRPPVYGTWLGEVTK